MKEEVKVEIKARKERMGKRENVRLTVANIES